MAGTTGSKEKGRLPLIVMEMGNLSRGQEISGTMSNVVDNKKNDFILVSSLSAASHPTPWMSG